MTMPEFTDGLCQVVYGKQIILLDYTLFLYSCLLSKDSVFFFLNKMKSTLNVQRFQDIKDVQKNVTAGLKVTQKERFYKCFHQWHHHWTKYLAAKEDSFEGNVRQSAMKSFWELKKRHNLSHF